MEEKSKCKKIAVVSFGTILTVGGFIAIPQLVKKYSNKMYKDSLSKEKIDFENLGPVIVKTETEAIDNNDAEDTGSIEEDNNGI